MVKYLKKWYTLLLKYPGENYFGIYKFLPAFFFLGAAIEFAMIHWKPNGINFYDVYKTKAVREEAVKRYNYWNEVNKLLK